MRSSRLRAGVLCLLSSGAVALGARTSVPAAPSGPRIGLTKVASADSPVGVIFHPITSVRYVIEKTGRLRPLIDDPASVNNTTSNTSRLGVPVLDVRGDLSSDGEQGLLGAAFSPDGAWLYVDFTNAAGDTRIRAYAWSNGRAAAKGRDLLAIKQPYPNHDGGQLVVTPDGVLWIGMGDGGSAGDPKNNAQNRAVLLGKILRILPTPAAKAAYAVPPGNLTGTGTRPEIWATGLRNPWRFSIDRATTAWIGDVGQGDFEEIDRVPTSAVAPNFGWRKREGRHPFNGGARPSGVIDPVFEYSHEDGGCSVIGGYVYRGTQLPALDNSYVYVDYCEGVLRALGPSTDSGGTAAARVTSRSLGVTVANPSSFGVDAADELYVTSLDGPVYRLDRSR